jgi:ferredoxin
VRALLDSTKCCGYGACADHCPSVFEIDEFGFGALRNGGVVPDGDENNAREAAVDCPEHAITLQD